MSKSTKKKVTAGMKIQTFEDKQFWNKLLHWNLVKTREMSYGIILIIIFTMFQDLVKKRYNWHLANFSITTVIIFSA